MNAPTPKLTRDDVEARFRALHGEANAKTEEMKPSIVRVAVVAGVVLLVITYLLGKRKGKRKTTIVEIRRV